MVAGRARECCLDTYKEIEFPGKDDEDELEEMVGQFLELGKPGNLQTTKIFALLQYKKP